MSDELTPPQRDAKDARRSIAKAAVSGVPAIGGPAAELFDWIVPASLEQRRDAWRERVADALRRLEQRGVRVEDLAEDEGFITIVLEASKAALGTHLEEKLDLLAACIESAALPEERDDFVAMRMLRFVEELSPEHFVVLRYLNDPAGWYDNHGLDPSESKNFMGPRRGALERGKVPVEGEVLDLVLHDLGDRGLASVEMLGGVTSGNAQLDRLSTALGRTLLSFVRLMAAG